MPPTNTRADGCGVRAGPDQQARAGRGRERDRRDQLRVVAAAGTLVGVGPTPIEHELAE